MLRPVRRLAVTSGKGGVGKSNFSLNLGICLQQLDQRTLLIDADTNLANIDILMGIHPKFTLTDVILGDKFVKDVLIKGHEGVQILPAGSGVTEMVGLDHIIQERIDQGMIELETEFDFIILDTGAGIAEGVVDCAAGADEVVVVTTPEPTAITDAYAAIKVISARNPAIKFYLLVNMVKNADEASGVFKKIQLVVENYLSLQIDSLGFLPRDNYLIKSVAQQQPFVLLYPRCPAAMNLNMIARRLLKLPAPQQTGGSLFRKLFS
ncbi:MinD/ParA family protein [bacterium]|nr:MinD/ParA family protein [bacterium]MBU1651662.1 MinD/ParA family protein [bacterium]